VFTTTTLFLGIMIAVGVAGLAMAVGEDRLGTPRDAPEEEQARRAELWRRARFDRRAAKDLHRRLRSDLAHHRTVRQDVVRRSGQGGRQDAVLEQDLRRAERDTRDQIAKLEVWLRGHP
jgi:hypothetical protein